MEEWALKDPIENFTAFLKNENILTEDIEVQYREEIMSEIHDGLEKAFAEPAIEAIESNEINDVFQDFDYQEIQPSENKETMRLVDAISLGLKQCMERHDNLVLMGQDIAEYGGVFKITDGFSKEFGKERVRNTPICESSIVSASMGLSINGFKAMMEMQFSEVMFEQPTFMRKDSVVSNIRYEGTATFITTCKI